MSRLSGFTQGYFTGSDENQVAYVMFEGDPNKPAVVLVHGLGADAIGWKPELECLRDANRTVIAYDLRGHGKSDASTWPGFYNFDALARDLRALVKQLIPDQEVVIVGHCIGGGIAQIYEEFYPGESHRLILMSTTANHRRTAFGLVLKMYMRLTPARYFHQPSRMSNKHRTYDAKTRGDFAFRKNLRAISATQPLNYAGLLLQFCNFDMRDELPNFKSPTTIVVGEHDSVFPLEHSQFLNERIPGSDLIILKGKNHLLPLYAAEDVCRIILER